MLEELAASYALGSLGASERDDFALHIEVCGVCKQLVAEFWTTAGMLDEAQEEQESSASLRNRIMSSTYAPVERTAAEQGRPPVQAAHAKRAPQRMWTGRSAPFAAMAAAAAVIAVIALAVWNISLQGRLDDSQQQVDNWQAMAEVIASGGQRIDLQGTENAPGAYAALFKDPDSDTAYMVFHDLPRPEGDDVFQLWVITGETPRSAGLIYPSAVGSGPVMVQMQLNGADAVGVSKEPPGGSDEPIGPIVLLGELT